MRANPLMVVIIASACIDSTGMHEGEPDPVAHEGCKLEEDLIGRENVTVQLGSKAVTLHDWVPKAGEPGAFVGFSMTVTDGAAIPYVVNATSASTAATWSHRDAITSVDFCAACDLDGCGPF